MRYNVLISNRRNIIINTILWNFITDQIKNLTMFNNEESTFSIIKVIMSVHLLINVALVFLKKTTKSHVRFSQCNVISLVITISHP